MVVCTHGEVKNYCAERNMIPVEQYVGDVVDYSGLSRIIVTDQKMSRNEYYVMKGLMLTRGYELVSIHYADEPCMIDLITHLVAKETEERKEKFTGRYMFGTNADGWIPEMREVVMMILDMKEKGFSLRQIKECPNVHHPDGRSLSISTIQNIIKNREKYEGIGL
jgi:hypothetical protein